ncbi:F510_1955 family glycosylhydrolase [Nesterenkonia natronophila]|nr:exo-alpha-sialidase [Nesterenkonia natronophila]
MSSKAPGRRPASLWNPTGWSGARAVTLVAVSTLALTSCGAETDSADPAGPSEGGEGENLEHVHGLDVDPSDGSLMIASHYGLFKLHDDGPRRVSEVQDFMGFTVVDEDMLLASGHPGEGQDAPANLGLISSADGGATWEEVSLSGEADFHALDAMGDRVYGVDAASGQELLISDDAGQTWQSSGAPAMASLAIDPRDADTVLGTTESGPVISTDGGQSFTTKADAPILHHVDWAPDGTIFALDPDAGVHRSEDNGVTWEHVGEVHAGVEGHPEALHAVDQDEVWAAVGGSILHSTDGGEGFDIIHEN